MVSNHIMEYLNYCQCQKCLDGKTLKAYRIDLEKFAGQAWERFSGSADSLTVAQIESIFAAWHQEYKPKTVKRKITSVKAYYGWLTERGYVMDNPFLKIHTKFRESKTLPKTIPEHTLEQFLQVIYNAYQQADGLSKKRHTLRDIAIMETLFGTGVRISELCSLSPADVNCIEGALLIHGKGRKERLIQIPDEALLSLLDKYYKENAAEIQRENRFFVNNAGRPISDQSVRRLIQKYAKDAGITQHITPHMFRHTFATMLLDSDVNLRCIQELLGHSSVSTTEIYTHVSAAKQRQVLAEHHPRKILNIEGGRI